MMNVKSFKIHHVLLGALTEAIRGENWHQALAYDREHYQKLVRVQENHILWDRWQADTFNLRLNALSQIRKSREVWKLQGEFNGPRRVLIVLPNFSGLAHEQQIGRSLRFLSKTRLVDFTVHVVYFSKVLDEHVKLSAEIYGTNFQNIHQIAFGSDLKKSVDELDRIIYERRINSVIYPSVHYFAFWVSALSRFDFHKFVVLKYFPKATSNFKSLFCTRANAEDSLSLNGDTFGQLSILDLKIRSNEFNQATKERKLEGFIYFGSISRLEKCLNNEYVNFVLDLLESNDKLVYLYTSHPSTVEQIPDKLRMHKRAQLVGWVEPTSFIFNIDIYLEPFPWGGGDMSLLALQCGIPYLCLINPTSLTYVGPQAFIRYVASRYSSDLEMSFSNSVDELYDRFHKCVNNLDARTSLGNLWKSCIADYQCNDVSDWHKLLS